MKDVLSGFLVMETLCVGDFLGYALFLKANHSSVDASQRRWDLMDGKGVFVFPEDQESMEASMTLRHPSL